MKTRPLTVLFDSRVVCVYLDALAGGSLFPKAGPARWTALVEQSLADGLLDAAILTRLEATWSGRSEHERSQAWMDRQMEKVQASLTAMSRGLGDKTYCSGIHLSLSDIAVGVALGYLDFRFPELDWRSASPNLLKLYDKLALRPSFVDTKPF